MQRIKELDGIRAVAIMLVLGCHYQGFAGLLGGLPNLGWVGVDIFFVLSGYLITTILLGLKGQATPYKTFYSRRAIRIFPPYIIVTGTCLAMALVSHRSPEILKPSFLLQQVFFLQAYSYSDWLFVKDFFLHLRWYALHPPPILQYAHSLPRRNVFGLRPSLGGPASTFWSLSVEEYFYLLWAPIVLRCRRTVVISFALTISIIEVILRCYCPAGLAYYGIFFRLDSLLYGAFLALLMDTWRRTSIPAWATKSFLAVFFLAALGEVWILRELHPILRREIRDSPLLLGPGLSLMGIATASLMGLLILRSNTRWWLARLFRLPILQFMGTISYTMYLVHILVALIVMIALPRLERLLPAGYLFVESVISAIVTILVARLSWHYLEKPLLRWKDRHFPGVPIAEPTLE